MSDDSRLFDAFDDCLGRLAAGETPDDCLRRYPALAAELQPMLAAALEGMAASRVPHHVQMRSRARFLGAAAARRPETRRASALGGWLRRGFSTAITLAVGFMLGTTGLYYASASTLPGDSLYGVKRAFENTRIQLASDPGERYTLERSYEERRAAELRAVLAEDRAVAVSFGGVLVSRTETAWQIGGFNVQLTGQTEIVGDPQPGFYVAVVAENQGGVLVALRLEAEETEIIGVLERSQGGWSIGGTSFVLGPEAVISGEVAPGVMAAARIRSLHTGERVAVSLVTVIPTAPASPTPTQTPAPSPSPTPRPTQTARPTRAPTLTPPPTAAPTQPPPTAQPAVATASGDDNGGEDNSGHGGGDDSGEDNSGSGDDGGDDNSGSGGGEDDGGDDSGGDNSGSGDDGGDDSGGDGSGSGDDGGDDNSGSGGGGDGDDGGDDDD